MKNVVSFETAVRLKEAGFPQPQPEFGQVWYLGEGASFIVYMVNEHGYVFGMYGDGLKAVIGRLPKELIFAPTATDILEQLQRVAIHKTDLGWRALSLESIGGVNGWSVDRASGGISASEVCAAEWIKEQPQ